MNFTHEELIAKVMEWAEEKKAEGLKYFDVRGKTDYTDGIIVCHGSVEMHLRAIAENIITNAKQNKVQILSKEGTDQASWILIDLGEVVVHIFNEETRAYYNLEKLLENAPKDRE